MGHLTMRRHPDPRIQSVSIDCDPETAFLIASALEIVNPDDEDVTVWARDCAFTIQTFVERSGFPPAT